jgi:seryl-tRNA synthetase
MIDLKQLIANPEIYKEQMTKRAKSPNLVDELAVAYQNWLSNQVQLEELRVLKNLANKEVPNLKGEAKTVKLEKMKQVSSQIGILENEARELNFVVEKLLKQIPCILSEETPIGKSDLDNPVIKTFGVQKKYDFEPKPYWELPIYKSTVSQDDGTKVMGSRGYYLLGAMAKFQKVLFDYALDIVLAEGFELMYVPLMLNEKVLTGTGHLPDFDGQQYQIPIDENRDFYLIGSSEPSIMGYYMDKQLGNLAKPILNTCWSSCFRKEAGSYGKDQQGILRVHQFEKIEMVAIARPEDTDKLHQRFQEIVEKIYNGLDICYQAVEVCTGDLPSKHRRQIDQEAWFPSQKQYREICSNGNAADYQNRGLRIKYTTDLGDKATPWGLNCTAMTFRTGLSILEQNQELDGRIKLPKALAQRYGSEYLE